MQPKLNLGSENDVERNGGARGPLFWVKIRRKKEKLACQERGKCPDFYFTLHKF